MFSLSDDYLNVTDTVHVWPEHYESPALLKRDGYYFVFGSQLSGWDPNDNVGLKLKLEILPVVTI